MPDIEQQHFWLEFYNTVEACRFRIDLRTGRGILDEHHYVITSRTLSPADHEKRTIDITVQNGGGQVDLNVIRQYAEQFRGGFTGHMGSF